MLQRYQGIIPAGVTVAEARTVARFFPVTGTLSLGRMNLNVASALGDCVFDIRVNGASEGTVTIPSGDREGLEAELEIEVEGGDMVEVRLTAWPVGGLVGPASCEVGVEDGESAGGTDEPLDKALLVHGYYNGAFGRDADNAELAADLAALESACLANTFVTQVMARIEALVDDAEFGAPTNAQFVQRVYRMYFGREPDATGQTFWEAQLAIGGGGALAANKDAMRATFAAHQEFVNRVALYCRAQLPMADAFRILGQVPATYIQSVVTGAVVTGIDLVVYTTAALAHGATENVSLNMGGVFWRVVRAEADRGCRVRAYFTNAQRTADAARPVGQEPTGNHGCIYDFVFSNALLDIYASKPGDGFNGDDLNSPAAWVAITNLSGATHTVQIILHRRLL